MVIWVSFHFQILFYIQSLVFSTDFLQFLQKVFTIYQVIINNLCDIANKYQYYYQNSNMISIYIENLLNFELINFHF